jgi:CBS domain-containing protein
MKRWLYAHHTVGGDPAVLERLVREQLDELLVAATGGEGVDRAVDGTFTVHLDSSVAGVPAGKDIRVQTGVATRAHRRLRMPVAWAAATSRHLYPAFDGAVELEALSSNAAQLTLAGPYTVPLGPVGAVVDAAGLHRVAERTAAQLLRDLARALGEAAGTGDVQVPPADAADAGAVFGVVQPPRPTVGDVMTRDPVIIDESLPVRTAALLLFHYRIGGAPVVSELGELVGVLSEADLLEKEALLAGGFERLRAQGRRDAVTTGEACSRPARVTHPEATLQMAAREMLDHQIARLVVVDRGDVVGIVTRHDVLRALVRTDAELQAAVDLVLRGLAEDEVTGDVEWGVVHLRGTTRLRSRIPYLVQALRDIDGIVAVDDELSWNDDDTDDRIAR